MNINYKPLIWSGAIVMVILSVFLLVNTSRVWNTAATTNIVSFSGEGKIFSKPDIAIVSFSILTEAKTSKEAQNSNSEKSKKVIDFVNGQGTKEKDIKTTSYNIYPQYSYTRPCPPQAEYLGAPDCVSGQQKITSYQVNQSFEIKVRDLDKVSTMLDGLVTAGANQVDNLGFQIDNIEKAKNDARELAIKDAKEKANTLKNQLGIKLGKIVNFSENTGGYPVPIMFEAKGMGGGMSGGPSVPTGENEITVNVTLTYQIR